MLLASRITFECPWMRECSGFLSGTRSTAPFSSFSPLSSSSFPPSVSLLRPRFVSPVLFPSLYLSLSPSLPTFIRSRFFFDAYVCLKKDMGLSKPSPAIYRQRSSLFNPLPLISLSESHGLVSAVNRSVDSVSTGLHHSNQVCD